MDHEIEHDASDTHWDDYATCDLPAGRQGFPVCRQAGIPINRD
jgi:hypothetical protein